MGFIKRKFKETRTTLLQRSAARKQIQAKARAAGFKAREEQAVRFAQQREKLKVEQKLKRIKSRPTFGQSVGTVLKTVAPPRRAAPRRRKRKGKRRRRTTRTTTQSEPRRDPFDLGLF